MEKNPKKTATVVAIDIGTTKVCAVVGKKNEHGKLEILGFGKVASDGVSRGVVTNIEKTVKAIKDAATIARNQAGVDFEWVHVGVAGQHIKTLQHRGILTRDHGQSEINNADIEKLISDMHKLVLPPGDKIIHVIPQEFTIDNEQGICDPIGMSGVRLEANFHIITGQITASNNLVRCVERCGLHVANMTLEPIASARAVLSDEEKEAGVALVDIGGGTTDLTIFKEGIIRHTAVIAFGGNVITKDIKEGCKVMDAQAEKLKIKFGSAMAAEVFDNRIISIPGLKGREPKEISESNLSRIIQARVEEILDYVIWEITRSGYEDKLIGGIVLTGGGSLLNHIDKLTEYHTGFETRIGYPVEHLGHGYSETISSPVYSTVIGLLLKGIEDVEAGIVTYDDKPIPDAKEIEEEEEIDLSRNGSWLDNIFRKTKEWFEAEPDSEF
jgi:cell division protein FtsA